MFHDVERHVSSYSAFWASKRKTWKKCLSDVLSSRMALRTHNIPYVHLKYDFGEVDETMFEDVVAPCEVIFCIIFIEKIDLV
jgi:hypothetical protein